jgi:hypothetical protein
VRPPGRWTPETPIRSAGLRAGSLVLHFHNYGDVFQGGSSGGAKRMIVKAGEKFAQVGASEGPLKGSGSLLVVVLEGEQTLLEFGEGGEVIGSEDLALNDGEIDLDLIEPAGMDRGVDEHDRGPRGAQAVGGFFAAVGGTVVGNPKDAPRGAIGFYRHDLFYEAVEWLDAGGALAAAEEPGAMDIPGGNVRAGTGALVLVLSMRVQRPGAGGREGWMRMRAWMLVFSSADSTKSRRPSGAPFQQPW